MGACLGVAWGGMKRGNDREKNLTLGRSWCGSEDGWVVWQEGGESLGVWTLRKWQQNCCPEDIIHFYGVSRGSDQAMRCWNRRAFRITRNGPSLRCVLSSPFPEVNDRGCYELKQAMFCPQSSPLEPFPCQLLGLRMAAASLCFWSSLCLLGIRVPL